MPWKSMTGYLISQSGLIWNCQQQYTTDYVFCCQNKEYKWSTLSTQTACWFLLAIHLRMSVDIH